MPHDVKVPDYVIERIMAKRGKLEVFDRFSAAKTRFWSSTCRISTSRKSTPPSPSCRTSTGWPRHAAPGEFR